MGARRPALGPKIPSSTSCIRTPVGTANPKPCVGYPSHGPRNQMHSVPKDYPSPPGPPPVGGAGDRSTGGGLALGPLLIGALGPSLDVTPDPPPVTPVLGAGVSAGACSVVVTGGAVMAGPLVEEVGASLLPLGWSPASLMPHAAAGAAAAQRHSNETVQRVTIASSGRPGCRTRPPNGLASWSNSSNSSTRRRVWRCPIFRR
jgi:hypothetical protein